MDYINKIINKFGANEIKSKAAEANFILFDYKTEDAEEKKQIEKARLFIN